jgi:recombination protein RecT
MAEKNEVALTFSEQLNDKLISVKDALPKDFNRERFVQNALAVINEKPELAKANKAQLQLGLLKGAYLGLDFMNKECYLITYGNAINFQTDYKGEIKFVKRYSIRKIHDIYARVVRQGDEFQETIKDGKPSFNFTPKPFSNAEIVGAFAVVLYEDGGMDIETMSKEDIQSVRNNYSKAANSKAWKNSFDEMSKKVVLRRLCKHIETDFETVEAKKAWEEGSGVEFTNQTVPGEVVDVFHVEDVEVESTVIEPNESEEANGK